MMGDVKLLVCTDLDRTLIPNGAEPESEGARERFARLVATEGVTLAYVSGRHRALVEQAIAEWDLPVPDYCIGDVGTTIYRVEGRDWTPVEAWAQAIGADWSGSGHDDLAARLVDLDGLQLQEVEKQGRFKLSWYAPARTDSQALLAEVRARIAPTGARCSLIWSIDEAAGVGLLDILPSCATKYHSVDFLMRMTDHDLSNTVFSGDSGNDLEVLVSPIPATLVANGHPEVREQASRIAEEQGNRDVLYLATGALDGMNGNYAAGILEGILHYHPGYSRLV